MWEEAASREGASLRRCANLQSLDVGHNALGAAGVCALVGALDALPSLTWLSLAATGASDDGAAALAEQAAARAAVQAVQPRPLVVQHQL